MNIKAAALLATLAWAGVACGDETGPQISLVGTWDFIGFSDAGIEAATTGTWTFEANNAFHVIGTVTFPGEPTDSLVVSGSYSQQESQVELTIGADTGSWTITGDGDVVVLTEIEPAPANTITLRRP
jgi:hypothetical protein